MNMAAADWYKKLSSNKDNAPQAKRKATWLMLRSVWIWFTLQLIWICEASEILIQYCLFFYLDISLAMNEERKCLIKTYKKNGLKQKSDKIFCLPIDLEGLSILESTTASEHFGRMAMNTLLVTLN